MAKFKQVTQSFLFGKLMKFWGNMVRNYGGEVHDDDFFAVVRTNFDHDKAVELIETAFSAKELEEMQNVRSRRLRLDLEDPLDDIFQTIWNCAHMRDKCKRVLEGIHDYMVAENPASGREEALERRFRELGQLLKLSDLETEILVFAYVRCQTCFDWPCRVDDREKPLYYAMALDRSYAEVEHAILFFDEIDGLVQSRENAQANWEVSQVNELLQQMENFDGVMIAATNFSKNLDPAIMRRFTFKLEFDYLTDEGKKVFFERMFRTTLTDGEFAELKTLRNLAPGDFRTVRQENFYLADEQTNRDRIEALREECRMKKDGDNSPRIGFGD